jgi:hypothetical protein
MLSDKNVVFIVTESRMVVGRAGDGREETEILIKQCKLSVLI